MNIVYEVIRFQLIFSTSTHELSMNRYGTAADHGEFTLVARQANCVWVPNRNAFRTFGIDLQRLSVNYLSVKHLHRNDTKSLACLALAAKSPADFVFVLGLNRLKEQCPNDRE